MTARKKEKCDFVKFYCPSANAEKLARAKRALQEREEREKAKQAGRDWEDHAMKSIQEQLKEALAKLPEKKRSKIQEAAWTDELKLSVAGAELRAHEQFHAGRAPTKKNNGVDDNGAPGQGQARESAKLALAESAKKAFGLDDRAARIFAGMAPSDDDLREAIKNGDSTVTIYDQLMLECRENIAKNRQ